jgi:AcrR family transcriptional regulator
VQHLESKRKSPRQARSRATVEALLKATSELLVRDGFHKTSTNRIAKRAGVSIGSLYQYFPNKEALVLGLVERLQAKQWEIFQQKMTDLADAPLDLGILKMMESMVAVRMLEPELTRVLSEQLPKLSSLEYRSEFLRRGQKAIFELMRRRGDQVRVEDLEFALYVTTFAVEGVLSQATLDGKLSDPRIPKQMAELLLCYLQGPPSWGR